MQGENLINRIIADANLKVEENVENAKLKADEIISSARAFEKEVNDNALVEANLKSKEILERYLTNSRIDGNKIILKKKQEILKDLFKQALSFLLSSDKKDLIKFVENLIKENAKKEEILTFNLPKITKSDLTKLPIVKELKLEVKQNKEIQAGIILSNDIMDKNFIFEDLIVLAFNENEDKINGLLFK